tara:strand:- start:72 stop:272 length:201 start_codon:yes stop_codon:yes gene_type:complete
MDNSDKLIDKYITLIKSGMNKDKAIDELMTHEDIKKSYDRSDIEFILVSEIDDKSIANLDDDFTFS